MSEPNEPTPAWRVTLETMAREADEFVEHAEANRDDWFSTMPVEVSAARAREAEAIRAGLSALDAATARAAKAEEAIYVPGVFRCTKCNFTLVQRTLHAQTGNISLRDDPGEKCPNDGAPLWRMTHEQQTRDAHEQWEEQVKRAVAAETELTTLRARIADLEAQAGVLKGYRAATHWIGADSWDGCSDCMAVLRMAAEADPERDMSPNEVALALKALRFEAQAQARGGETVGAAPSLPQQLPMPKYKYQEPDYGGSITSHPQDPEHE